MVLIIASREILGTGSVRSARPIRNPSTYIHIFAYIHTYIYMTVVEDSPSLSPSASFYFTARVRTPTLSSSSLTSKRPSIGVASEQPEKSSCRGSNRAVGRAGGTEGGKSATWEVRGAAQSTLRDERRWMNGGERRAKRGCSNGERGPEVGETTTARGERNGKCSRPFKMLARNG